MIFFIAAVILFIWVAYTAMELRKATLAIGLLLVAYMLIGDPSTIYTSILWILFGLLVFNPLADCPQGETGLLPPDVFPSPPP